MGPSLWARIQKAKYGVETPGIASEEEIQDPTFRGKGDANAFLLEDYLQKGHMINSARYSDLLANNPKPAVCTKRQGYCRRKCCCCMTMHAHTRPATPLKPLIIWISRCWNTLPTAQISPLPTTISLDHSKMHYEVIDFLRTKKCGKRCINDCATKRKPSWREYASLWTAGPSGPKRKETVEKWRTCSGLHLCK